MTKRKGKTQPPPSDETQVLDESHLSVEAFQRALSDASPFENAPIDKPGIGRAHADTAPRREIAIALRDFFAEFDANDAAAAGDDPKRQHRLGRVQNPIEDYLTFLLEREVYGLPISKVREIIKPLPLTFVPRQPSHVSGILSLRGSIVPIFALKAKLGLGTQSNERGTRIVVVEDGDNLIGFFVDQVRDVVRLELGSVEPSPTWKGSQYQDIIRGVGRKDEQMIILLEFDMLLSHLRAASSG